MAYTKQEWNCGDTITADKMNHIEDGIEAASSGGSGTLVIRMTSGRAATTEECQYGGTVGVADHSYQDVIDAIDNNQTVIFVSEIGSEHEGYVCWYLSSTTSSTQEVTFDTVNYGHDELYLDRITLVQNETDGKLVKILCSNIDVG